MEHRPLYKAYARYRLELFSSFGVVIWGFFLLNPYVDSFTRFASFGEMAKHASENEWGFMAVVIGLCSLLGLYLKDAYIRRAGMIGVLWLRTFTLMFVGFQNHFANTGTGDYFLWALMAWIAFVRIDNEF